MSSSIVCEMVPRFWPRPVLTQKEYEIINLKIKMKNTLEIIWIFFLSWSMNKIRPLAPFISLTFSCDTMYFYKRVEALIPWTPANMALPVDSFGLLLDEISSTYRNLTHFDLKSLRWKDWLAILGALYATSKAITAASHAYAFIKQYGLARFKEVDLVRKYGPWAGGWNEGDLVTGHVLVAMESNTINAICHCL